MESQNKKSNSDIISIIQQSFKPNVLSNIKEFRSDEFLVTLYDEQYASMGFEKDEEEEFLLTCFYSSNSIENFNTYFNDIPSIDFDFFNKHIFEIQFLHAYLTGVQLNKYITSIEDLKFYFQYDGNNYRHQFMLDENYTFAINFNYYLNLMTGKFELRIFYDYTNDKLRLNFHSVNFEDIKNSIFKYISKQLNKELKDITLVDHQIIKLLTY